jgi:hypothetical protein
MIASPGDVQIERDLARDIVHEWNAIHSPSRGMALMPIGWETHSHPSMEDRAQGVLNKQILKYADLLVAIFWTRIGTPTGEAVSGSVEEIEKHIAAGKPAMIYFSSAPVRLDSVDEAQYRKLKEFKEQIQAQSRGLFETYDTPSNFADKFRRQLATKINNDAFFHTHIQGGSQHVASSVDRVVAEAAKKIPAMSDEAKTLIIEASLDRGGHILHARYINGVALQTNGKQLIADRDPRSIAAWEGALDELARLGLIKAQGDKGEDVAELLRP